MRKFIAGQALSERRITLCSHKLPKWGAAALPRFDDFPSWGKLSNLVPFRPSLGTAIFLISNNHKSQQIE